MTHLICPVCVQPLADAGRAFVCERGHTFDRAREGYTDLLPQGYGRRNIAGDTAEMVAARRRFLAAGHYRPLLDAVTARVREHMQVHIGRSRPRADPVRDPEAEPPVLVDAGCGDGYYGGNVADAVAREGGACLLYGLDISRPALKAAARARRDGLFFRNDVASRITLGDASADALLDIFAPRNADEFARVLRPGGLALVVVPDESHLQELRAAIPLLSIRSEKRERVAAQLSAGFLLRDDSAIHYVMRLDPAELQDLIKMSPSAHHLDEAHLKQLRTMDVTASFHVMTFVRRD